MLKIRIIPCLDVKNGRIVKGVNFKNLKDAGDPVLTAQVYDELGADEICFLDIAATLENRDVTLDLVRKTSEKCFIPITVGGGIRTIEDIRHLLLNGADKVSFNSAAIRDPDIISTAANKFGSQCIVVAIDAKKTKNDKWEIFSHGGTKETGIEAISFAKDMQERGAGEILLTSMDKDGTKDGYDIELTKLISDSLNIPVIASGGAGKLEHFKSVLEKGKASAILAASIFHFGEISIKQVKSYLRSEGIPVRM
ncbi:MAG: imidazole glycerol phosphate synthase subunit HisF [Pseudomonadota bacterium]|mgnify:FL=1|jgi:cyclase|nr:imidazole glycerol phosphate synthase subunit HisF [Rhodobacterales bacterium]MEE2621531.1 imidazole glycerol phosphate synthase subunit HisF [Pseudomonadota bacterium]|tara:strand:+ start:85 stop:843 length:759 start_codon:yes stop_codon:yes gene_type:complete